MNHSKYKRLVKQVSVDGINWRNAEPFEYKAGEEVESDSPFCGGSGDVVFYKWLETDETMCINKEKWTVKEQYKSYDGEHWVGTGVKDKGFLIELDSDDCGKETWKLTDRWVCAVEIPENTMRVRLFKDTYQSTSDNLPTGWTLSVVDDSIPDYDIVDLTYQSVISGVKLENFFYGWTNLISLDYAPITDAVTSLYRMFYGCTYLQRVSTEGWDTTNVNNMYDMFMNCANLVEVVFDNGFYVENVSDFHAFFSGCSKLKDVNLSAFNTADAQSFSFMFRNCASMTSLDLSHFNTSNLKETRYMFNGMSNLETLNLSGWDLTGVTQTTSMFSCPKLNNLIVTMGFFRTTQGLDLTTTRLGLNEDNSSNGSFEAFVAAALERAELGGTLPQLRLPSALANTDFGLDGINRMKSVGYAIMY